MNTIIDEIYDKSNDIWGYPQTYKNIKFYPLKIAEEEYIKLYNKLLAYPQIAVSLENPKVYKMSYLKFLVYILPYIMGPNPANESFKEELKELLAHITQIDIENIEISVRNQDAQLEGFIMTLYIDEEIFTESDFSNIRDIILRQNGSSSCRYFIGELLDHPLVYFDKLL